jgi:Domain of unknown function (DUF4384)
MRFKTATTLAALALLTLAPAYAQARQQGQKDQKVIDDFVTTRGIIFDAPKTPAAKPKAAAQSQGRRRPAPKSPDASKKNPATTPDGATQGGTTANPVEPAEPAADDSTTPDGAKILKSSAPGPIAVGYTIYLKDDTGALLATDASRVYKKGEGIALSLETNTDGFLYVFNATDGKNPSMLFPSVMVDDGANAVRAHVRETYPAGIEDAFLFDEQTGSEHVYIIVSRDPLAGVPTGEALGKFCAGKDPQNCEWHPDAALWARITAGAADRRVVEARNRQLARAVEPVLPEALTRGIHLKRQDPKPSVVRVSDSPFAKMLVTKIELAHK